MPRGPYEAVAEEEQACFRRAIAATFREPRSLRACGGTRDRTHAVSINRLTTSSAKPVKPRRLPHHGEGSVSRRAKLDVEFTPGPVSMDDRIGRKLVTEGHLVKRRRTSATMLTTVVSLDP